MIPLIEGTQAVKFLETESRMVVTRGWGEMGSFTSWVYRVFV